MDPAFTTVPLLSEEVRVSKRLVEQGGVHISVLTRTEESQVAEDLASSQIKVERVRIDRPVETAPDVRQEGCTTVYPVLEERLVKQLILVEEIRVTESHRTRSFEEIVTLRRQHAVVERIEPVDEVPNPET